MGGPARPLHEPGNHRSSERCSHRHSADCGSLIERPTLLRITAPTPRPGARSDGKMRTLRKGSGQWTCMPGHADPANPDPMCGDKNAMEWAHAWMDHKEPPANKVGFMYMLRGDGGASNTDPYATKEEPGNNWIKTGAHVMIVGSGAKMLDGYPRDAKADPTRPYVMWPGTQYEHLMLPVR